MICSIAPESHATAKAAVKDHVDALLKKFLCVPDPETLAKEVGSGGADGVSDVDDGLPATGTSGGND